MDTNISQTPLDDNIEQLTPKQFTEEEITSENEAMLTGTPADVNTGATSTQCQSSEHATKRKRLARSEKKRLLHQQRLAQQKLKRQKVKQQHKLGKGQLQEVSKLSEQEEEQEQEKQEQEKEEQEPQEQEPGKEEQEPGKQEKERHVSKRLCVQQMRERQRVAMTHGQRVAIDCSLEKFMSPKECSKLAQQLCRLYGYNRRSSQPLHLYFTGLNTEGQLYAECLRKNDGFKNYLVDMNEKCHNEVFSPAEIVYLSPDSPNILTSVDREKVYIIGGLVDEHIQKGKSLSSAEASGTQTARLPINEYMEKTDTGTFKKVLTVNQVFAILLTFVETGDWKTALQEWVPARQGYTLKTLVS